MTTQKFHNASGFYMGAIETTGNTSKLIRRDGRIMGYYDATSNWTTRSDGTRVGQGNLLTTLLGK